MRIQRNVNSGVARQPVPAPTYFELIMMLSQAFYEMPGTTTFRIVCSLKDASFTALRRTKIAGTVFEPVIGKLTSMNILEESNVVGVMDVLGWDRHDLHAFACPRDNGGFTSAQDVVRNLDYFAKTGK